LLAATAASLLLAAPVAASAGLSCEGAGGFADVAMGRLIVLNVIGAHAEIGGKTYSTGPERGAGEPFVVGQAFAEDDDMMIDFVDPNFETIVVGLRVKWNAASEEWVGTLTSGETVIDVTCLAG
jgi:hypothetical protein